MTLSAYFMSKSVFDVQGCRALTLALARLSCLTFGANITDCSHPHSANNGKPKTRWRLDYERKLFGNEFDQNKSEAGLSRSKNA